MTVAPIPPPQAEHDGPASRPLLFVGEGLVEITLAGENPALDFGGDAANAATMCALMGGHARLVGRVGDDPLGRRLLAFWQGRGIDTTALLVDEGAPTGLYVNSLPEAGGDVPRSFTYWRHDSAGSRWSVSSPQADEMLGDAAAVVVTGITVSLSESCARGVWELVERARALGIPTVCLLNYRAPLNPDRATLARLATVVDVLIASTEDLGQVFPDRSAQDMLEHAVRTGAELVVTDGAAGATVAERGGIMRQPARPVAVRNTVGAGDALAGAYLWARFGQGEPPRRALPWGVAAAMSSIQRDGCASSYPDALEAAVALCELPSFDRSAT